MIPVRAGGAIVAAVLLAAGGILAPAWQGWHPAQVTQESPALDSATEVLRALSQRVDPDYAAHLRQLLDDLELTASPSGTPAEALQWAGAWPTSPLPLPDVPEGPAPLAQALLRYEEAVGAPPSTLDAMRQASEGLGLSLPGQVALSRLVLAYTQALEVQTEALASLDDGEFAALSGVAGEAQAARAAAKVDGEAMRQAADLLLRAALEARDALVPAPATDANEGWFALEAILGAATVRTSPSTSSSPSTPVTLDVAVAALAERYGGTQAAPLGLRQVLPPSLDAAIAGIVQAHADGIGQDPAVHARAVADATQAAAPVLQAWSTLLRPAGADEVVLSALLATAVPDLGAGSPSALASAALGARPASAAPLSAEALVPLLEWQGLTHADAVMAAASLPAPASGALALVLAAEQGLAAAHAAALDRLDASQAMWLGLTPTVAAILLEPAWSSAQASAVESWAEALHAVAPALPALAAAQAQALAATEAAADLLRAMPQDIPMTGNTRSSDAPPASPPDPLCPLSSAFSDCDNDVFLEIDAGQGILVTGRGSTRIDGRFAGGDAHIILDLGGNDVYRVSAGTARAGLGLPPTTATTPHVSAGIPSQDVGAFLPSQQAPGESAGNLAQGRTFAVAIDAAGDDRYASASVLAQGAAQGLGAVGILWDAAGDDGYLQEADPSSDLQHGQGAGTMGGLGVLIDRAGSDTYEAPNSRAQGVGWSPPPPFQAVQCGVQLCVLGATERDAQWLGGVGILLDAGAGSDSFSAKLGQGHSAGLGTVGILVDLEGATTYTVSEPTLSSQGGRGIASQARGVVDLVPVSLAAPAGGFAALLDLGGPGDSYTSPRFPAFNDTDDPGFASLRPVGREPRKEDHAAWVGAGRGMAFGLDSSLGDQDRDGVPDLGELLAGSDPENATDRQPDPGPARTTLEAIAATVVPGLQDTDGDGSPDVAEHALGSDADDPASTPGNASGFLLSVGSVCAAGTPTECEADAVCDPSEYACLRLLAIGGPGSTTHDRPTIVTIDLGGDDAHPQAAGPGATRQVTAGSILVDVAGDDLYGSPTATETLAFARGGASLLFDLGGTDRYRAAARAQASVQGPAVAILADLEGDDRYEVGSAGQAHAVPGASNEAALAFLLDAGGADRYTFETQAAVVGRPSDARAVLLDLQGRDRYTSTALPSDLSDGPDATPFEVQGRLDRRASPPGQGTLSLAWFIDAGEGVDDYFLTDANGTRYPAREKDGAGTVRNAIRGPSGPQAGDSGTALGQFTDGLTAVLADADGDSWPLLAEGLLGTDPADKDSAPVSQAGPGADVRPDAGGAGSAGDNLQLPGLLVASSAPQVHAEYVPFLVDLGGNDNYTAPNAGGASVALHHLQREGTAGGPLRFATALLLDVGGDDTYAPQPCVDDILSSESFVAGESPGSLQAPDAGPILHDGRLRVTHCPSLGGTVGGVAVLVDGGGNNSFTSRMQFDVATKAGSGQDLQAGVRAWGATQGAALFHGVGALVTFGVENRFLATVVATAREMDELDPTPLADAVGLAQGASWGRGVGLLASLGAGSDTYVTSASASAPQGAGTDAGRAWSTAQGAAKGGVGILVDDGGANSFAAPAGFAQGSAFRIAPPLTLAAGAAFQDAGAEGNDVQPSIALLRTGPGRDALRAGPSSQGSAAAPAGQNVGVLLDAGGSPSYLGGHAVGWLVDGGGDDLYELDAGTPSPFCPAFGTAPAVCSLSQGAVTGSGSALLLDWGGNDVYAAPGLTHVQGAGAFVTQGALDQGTLLDVFGHDRYVAYDDAQGALGGTLVDLEGDDSYTLTKGAQGTGLFADLGGQDKYAAGRSKTRVGSVESTDGNNWIWSAGAPGSLGIDSRGLALLGQATGTDFANVTIAVARDPEATSFYPPNEPLAGTVHLVADVQPSSEGIWKQASRHVEFFLDGELVGNGVPRETTPDDSLRFVLAWNTQQGSAAVTDGAHRVKAVVLLGPDVSSARHLATPQGMHASSLPLDVLVDNGVTGLARLSGAGLSPHVPTSHVVLSVDASPDLGDEPFGLEVRLQRGADQWIVNQTTIPPGQARAIVLDGTCGPTPCVDGQYDVLVDLLETGFPAQRLSPLQLLVDGTAPAGALAVPRFAGPAFQAGVDLLDASWIESDEGAGVANATLEVYGPDGVLRSMVDVPAGTRHAAVPVANGGSLTLALVLRDRVGNVFDPCATTPALACPAAINVTADFSSPRLLDTAINRTLVGPDGKVRVTTRAWDDHTHLATAEAVVDGAGDLSVALQPVGPQDLAADFTLPAAPPREAAFQVQVHVTDPAGNLASSEVIDGMMDSRAPRLGAPTITYEDGSSTPTVGRPGGTAIVRLMVEEHDLAFVQVRAPHLGMPSATPCLLESAPVDGRSGWRCEVPIPPDTTGDAPRIATVLVQDKAGNAVNTTHATVVLDEREAVISDLRVVSVGPDFIDVAWNTSTPTTGRVFYGRTGLSQRIDDPLATTEHAVRLPGLVPSKTYSFQVVARTMANIGTTSAVMQASTVGGFQFTVDAGDRLWRGNETIPLQVTSHVADPGLILVSFTLRGPAALADLPLLSRSHAPGLHQVGLETRGVPDGTYVLLAKGLRGEDEQTVTVPAIRIDNTPPALTILGPLPESRLGTAKPAFTVNVLDPGRSDPLRSDTVELRIDGTPILSSLLTQQGQNLTVHMDEALPPGRHEVNLTILDHAGNRGEAVWHVVVDAVAPAINGTPAFTPVGFRLARPGSDVDINLRLDDGAGVASVRIENGAKKVALASADGLNWTGRFQVPMTATHGTFEVQVLVQDNLGANETLLLPLAIDALPPTVLDSGIVLAGPADVEVAVVTQEPSTVRAGWGGNAASSALGTTHVLRLPVTAPGRIVPVLVNVTDEAGNGVKATLAIAMPPDLRAPSAVNALNATSPSPGTIALRWQPSQDDIGIDSYELVRTIDGRSRVIVVPGNQTRFDDVVLPGSLVHYTVRAIDHAGLASPEAATQARALLTSLVDEAQVSPATGPADKPFHLSFNYSHPAGLAPDRVFVRYGDLEIALDADVDGDCAEACQVFAKVRLPPRSAAKEQPEMSVVILVDGVESESPLEAPVVMAGKSSGVHVGKPGTPSLAVVPLALAILALASWRRRRA